MFSRLAVPFSWGLFSRGVSFQPAAKARRWSYVELTRRTIRVVTDDKGNVIERQLPALARNAPPPAPQSGVGAVQPRKFTGSERRRDRPDISAPDTGSKSRFTQ
jgi:hypothetical protein